MSDLALLRLNRALSSFSWLPHERWTPDQLFAFYHLPNGQMCKICDEPVMVSKQEAHIAEHLKQDKERIRIEKAEGGVTVRERKLLDTEGVLTFLSNCPKGETVLGISTQMKRNINDVYKEIKVLISEGKVESVGTFKIPGRRGKPAQIYAVKEG